MPDYLHPGVYVQEAPATSLPIEGVSTATAAFIGVADKGPVPGTLLATGRMAQPVLVTSFTQYTRIFGGFRQDSFLTYAVQAFFQNGGQSLYVVRVVPAVVSPPSVLAASATGVIGGRGAPTTINFSALNPGQWGNNIWVQLVPSSDGNTNDNFKLLVMYGATQAQAQANIVESYDIVTYQGSPNLLPGAPFPATYLRSVVNNRSEYIALTSDFTATPGNISSVVTTSGINQLSGGTDGTTSAVNFVGAAATDNTLTGTGLYALDKITNVNLVAIPGQGDPATVNQGVQYCKMRRLQDCFFIGDVGSIQDATVTTNVSLARLDSTTPTISKIGDARNFATSGFGGVALDRSSGDYGAVYFPWIYASDPIGSGRNPRILLPPSGFVAGIYARIDNSRGVFKAPAGVEAGVSGALAAYVPISDVEQDQLNPVMVNAIRTTAGSGLVVWGARTFSSDSSWRYVPVRRMAIFLRVSIYNGIQWAVFQPNDEALWSSLRLNIRAFMLTQFRAGAFQGSTPDGAFFVKCDSSTTTQTDIDNGVVNILVGFAPLKPAEFVVLKLSQKVNQPTA